MPNNLIKSFATKSKKSEEEVERIWKDTEQVVSKEYPTLSKDDDRFWSLVNKIVQRRLKIQDETITTTTANVGDGMSGQHFKRLKKKKKKDTYTYEKEVDNAKHNIK